MHRDSMRCLSMKLRRLYSAVITYLIVVGLFLTATFWGSEAISVIAQRIPMERDHTIIIDAGHGGPDGGATSCAGVLESQINLEISLRLNDLFHLLGYQTRMIRTTDTSVYTEGDTIAQKKISDLKERIRIVNETENAILVSIHQNTFPEARYSGAQVFYGPKGEGKPLAEKMQGTFCHTLNPGSSRRCKKADGIYLMQNVNCTAILVECGFLSNPQEEGKLRTPEYQKQLCCVIASSVSKFLDHGTND